MKTIRTAVAGLLALAALVLAGCAGKVAPDVDEGPLQCDVTTPAGALRPVGTCPTGASEGDACFVPVPSADRVAVIGYHGVCVSASPPSS